MQMMPPRQSLRVFFSKTGLIRYTSHLDTVRTLTRALRRSELPVWYTQGFNPHPYLAFPLPIALGYESVCESLDIRLVRELEPGEAVVRLNAALPAGFRVFRAAPPEMEPSAIAWADYDIALKGYRDVPEAKKALLGFAGREAIPVVKKTKKGERELDLRPLFTVLEAEAEGGVLRLRLRLASGNTLNINPTLFLEALYGCAGEEPASALVRRIAILDGQGRNFC